MSISLLLERVEGASGADRELDGELGLLARKDWPSTKAQHVGGGDIRDAGGPYSSLLYTSSIDAALVLVERRLPGWRVGLNSDPDRGPPWSAQVKRRGEGWDPIGHLAPTPALAILAAMLKALSANGSSPAERQPEPREDPEPAMLNPLSSEGEKS